MLCLLDTLVNHLLLSFCFSQSNCILLGRSCPMGRLTTCLAPPRSLFLGRRGAWAVWPAHRPVHPLSELHPAWKQLATDRGGYSLLLLNCSNFVARFHIIEVSNIEVSNSFTDRNPHPFARGKLFSSRVSALLCLVQPLVVSLGRIGKNNISCLKRWKIITSQCRQFSQYFDDLNWVEMCWSQQCHLYLGGRSVSRKDLINFAFSVKIC